MKIRGVLGAILAAAFSYVLLVLVLGMLQGGLVHSHESFTCDEDLAYERGLIRPDSLHVEVIPDSGYQGILPNVKAMLLYFRWEDHIRYTPIKWDGEKDEYARIVFEGDCGGNLVYERVELDGKIGMCACQALGVEYNAHQEIINLFECSSAGCTKIGWVRFSW